MLNFSKTKLLVLSGTLLASPVAWAADRSFDYDPITEIISSAGVAVEITHGEQQSLTASSNVDWELDHLEISYNNGTLKASQNFGFWDFFWHGNISEAIFHNGQRITLHLTIPTVKSLTSSSGSEISIENFSGENLSVTASSGATVQIQNITFESISLSASSGSEIDVQGECTQSTISTSSGADIEAGQLICTTSIAQASSGASVEIYASSKATANASSGASIDVLGSPAQTEFHESSGGSVDLDN